MPDTANKAAAKPRRAYSRQGRAPADPSALSGWSIKSISLTRAGAHGPELARASRPPPRCPAGGGAGEGPATPDTRCPPPRLGPSIALREGVGGSPARPSPAKAPAGGSAEARLPGGDRAAAASDEAAARKPPQDSGSAGVGQTETPTPTPQQSPEVPEARALGELGRGARPSGTTTTPPRLVSLSPRPRRPTLRTPPYSPCWPRGSQERWRGSRPTASLRSVRLGAVEPSEEETRGASLPRGGHTGARLRPKRDGVRHALPAVATQLADLATPLLGCRGTQQPVGGGEKSFLQRREAEAGCSPPQRRV